MEGRTTISKEACAGAAAGMVGIFVGLPLDTVKVGQQVHGVGFTKSFLMILKTQGIRGFYRGMHVLVLAAGAFGAMQFSLYQTAMECIKYIETHWERKRAKQMEGSVPLTILVGGVVVGIGQSVLTTPTELVKIQLQMHGRGLSAAKCAQQIYVVKGFHGFYTGLGAALCKNIPFRCTFFLTYKSLSVWLKEEAARKGQHEPNKLGLFLAGGFSGMAAWWISMPMDAIKPRIQGVSLTQPRYCGVFDCVRKTYRVGRLSTFFRGNLAVSTRAFPAFGAMFLTYEWVASMLKDPLGENEQ